jgi:hypothetical protein
LRWRELDPRVSRWVAGRECRSDGFELEVERVGPASLEVGGGGGSKRALESDALW